jgi:hypothetical protein
MKVLTKLTIHVMLVTSLVFPHQSYAYLYGTDITSCAFFVCARGTTILYPWDLPTYIAVENSIIFFHSEGWDWGWDYGTTPLTGSNVITAWAFLNFPSGGFDIYDASTLHIFLEPDLNTKDEGSYDLKIYW